MIFKILITIYVIFDLVSVILSSMNDNEEAWRKKAEKLLAKMREVERSE